jgi:hypothetical protein
MASPNNISKYPKELYGTSIYGSWYNMKTRCNNPKSTNYKQWGGRGIKVCDEWNLFAGFLKDMQDSYFQGASIERIDNDGNYCKENCKWATRKEQCRNRGNNLFIKGKTLSEWSEILGVKRSTLAQRYYVYNWSVDKCLAV